MMFLHISVLLSTRVTVFCLLCSSTGLSFSLRLVVVGVRDASVADAVNVGVTWSERPYPFWR